MSKAFIQKPAPAFSAKAIDKSGEFVDIKLSDYKGTLLNINGNYFPLFDFALISISVSSVGKYLVLFFYPLDL